MTQPQTPGEAITRAAQRHADATEAMRALSRTLKEEQQSAEQGAAPQAEETQP